MSTPEPFRRILAEVDDAAAERHPGQSFWYHRRAERFPPAPVTQPEAFDGSDRLNLVCTQTSLPAAAQRRLVQRWTELLPTLDRVRFLWFHSKVPTALFEAACRMPGLEGLYVKWSAVDDLEPLTALSNLRYLRIGSSPGVRSIEPLARIPQLRWLELENLKHLHDLAHLAALTGLEGLAFDGASGGRHELDTLRPLAALRGLRWLKLGAVRAADDSLRPLAELGALRWLGIAGNFPMEEFAWLSTRLLETECQWFRPYVVLTAGMTCRRCRTAHPVMLTGRGRPTLCPLCDGERILRHVREYERIVAEAGGTRIR